MKDSRERFTETAEAYARYRPSYPPDLVDWVIKMAGIAPPLLRPAGYGGQAARVADVGCGTGIASRLFAARGFRVTGIDPNEEMLAWARKEGGAEYLHGEATRTGLPDASVSLVVSGQAFHWFDLPPTMAELRRILVPMGTCAAFWNQRARGPFLDEYEALLRTHSTEYRALPGAKETIPRIRVCEGLADVVEAEFDNAQELDREGLFGRAWSSSYVVHGVSDRAAFNRDLDALYLRHNDRGRVTFLYRTFGIAWRFRK